MERPNTEQPLPSWLTQSQVYQPQADRDGFITKSVLAVSSVWHACGWTMEPRQRSLHPLDQARVWIGLHSS
jgi:hypothetical protein